MTRCVNLVTSRVLDLAKAARPRVLDLAKAARDKKKADMSKCQPSSKETKAYTDTVASKKALADAAAASGFDYSTCHASLHGCVLQALQPRLKGAMIETGTRHTILICACTNPEKVAGILRTFRLSSLMSNVKRVLLHFTCLTTWRAHLSCK